MKVFLFAAAYRAIDVEITLPVPVLIAPLGLNTYVAEKSLMLDILPILYFFPFLG